MKTIAPLLMLLSACQLAEADRLKAIRDMQIANELRRLNGPPEGSTPSHRVELNNAAWRETVAERKQYVKDRGIANAGKSHNHPRQPLVHPFLFLSMVTPNLNGPAYYGPRYRRCFWRY